MENVENVVKEVISEQLELFNIKDHDSMEDLGADSLCMAEIIMAIADETEVKLQPKEIKDSTKVIDIINLVKSRLPT